MKESTVQAKVVAGLRAAGCLVKKIHGNEYVSGLPDLYVIKDGRHCWVEVKRPPSHAGLADGGKLRPEQIVVFTELTRHGAVIFVGDNAKQLVSSVMGYLHSITPMIWQQQDGSI